MRFRFALRSLLLSMLLFAPIAGWVASVLLEDRSIHGSINSPIGVAHPDMAPAPPEKSLTEDDVRWYINGRGLAAFDLPEEFVLTQVHIKFLRTSADPLKHVPLLGPTITHRHVFRCTVVGTASGKSYKRQFNLEETQAEMVSPPIATEARHVQHGANLGSSSSLLLDSAAAAGLLPRSPPECSLPTLTSQRRTDE